jgi:ABC-type Fe3+-hydroxamate transport system substrate-binding protein
MKTLITLLLFTVGLSGQNNQPTTALSGATTGTENITGAMETKVKAPAVNPERTETTASSATRTTSSTQPITNYGRNNDGSSTGTTATGNGSKSDSAPVDDGSAHPGDKAGNWIVTPRGR